MTNWIDSRVCSPSSNSFNTYFVEFLYCDSTHLGLADWMPKDNYTDGDWENVRCTNGNKLGGEVLYWMPHPKKVDLNSIGARSFAK